MHDLAGKVAVVTGAGSGIGRATALRLGRAGMRVVAADLDQASLDELANEFSAQEIRYATVITDVADPAAVRRLRAAAFDAFGGIHLVHNNAGVALPPMPIWEISEELWQWVLGVNVRGVINGIRTFTPDLIAQGEGHVVMTASLAGLRAGSSLGAYCASKHAVVAMSKALAADLERIGSPVGVSVVCPALVLTNLGESSQRHWPPGTPRPEGWDPRKDGSVTSSAMSAEAVADMIHDAVVKNQFWVMTHPEMREAVESQFRDVINAF
jgi:NAD(P)-dependent dehydrogenase (short-subunit alcohol dehydrogenase family)